MDVVFIKIGGSLITDKKLGDFKINFEVIDGISEDMKEIMNNYRIVLAHGAGTYGHRPVKEYGLQRGLNGKLVEASEVLHMVRILNNAVVGRLILNGIPAVGVSPRGFMTWDGSHKAFTEQIITMLSWGFVPVSHGDVVFSYKEGAKIVSADEIPLVLSNTISKAVFLTDAPGVLDERGVVLREVSKDSKIFKGDAGIDVTGGMLGKVERALKLAELGVDVIITDYRSRGDLIRALRGEKGTKVTT